MLWIEYYKNNELIKLDGESSDFSLIDESTENRVIIKIKAKEKITLKLAKTLITDKVNHNSLFFFNGYQSWTDTKENRYNDTFRDVTHIPKFLNKMFSFDRYGDALIHKYNKYSLHGYDIFYIKDGNEIFSFNYNYHNAYLIYELDKTTDRIYAISDIDGVILDNDQEFTIYDYSLYHNYKEGLKQLYIDYPEINNKQIFGYTSWYNYYQNINEEIILRDLNALDKRFNLFQIDDGYQMFVGDWLDINKDKFPNGLEGIVNKIHEKGYLAGIWLAPFVAEEKSKLFLEHPDYFKKIDGKPVKCGANWSGFYALDILNKDVQEYIKKVLNHFIDLGFDFFKLDFLYAVSLPKYEGYTRTMIAEIGYNLLSEVLKDKLILGCGAIISNSIKKFDYLRIGPDLSLKFDDVWYMRHMHRERISTKVTLQNTIYRSIFNNHFFGNDPDVFLLRSENSKLTSKQKKAILLLNSLFGRVLMTSDNLDTYSDDAKKDLGRAFEIFFDAKDLTFERVGNEIKIDYIVNGRIGKYIYNPNEGVLKYVGQK